MADKFFTPPTSPTPKKEKSTKSSQICSRCKKEFNGTKCAACVVIAALKYQDQWQQRENVLKNLEAAGRAHASRQENQDSCLIM